MLHNAGELTIVGSDMTPEQQARVNIDNLLEQAGWAVQDVGSVNLYAGAGVAVREFQGFTTPGRGDASSPSRVPLWRPGTTSTGGTG